MEHESGRSLGGYVSSRRTNMQEIARLKLTSFQSDYPGGQNKFMEISFYRANNGKLTKLQNSIFCPEHHGSSQKSTEFFLFKIFCENLRVK